MPRYIVTPLYEPRGEGAGWDDAPSDDVATFFSVDAADGSEFGLDGESTREGAQYLADRLNAANA